MRHGYKLHPGMPSAQGSTIWWYGTTLTLSDAMKRKDTAQYALDVAKARLIERYDDIRQSIHVAEVLDYHEAPPVAFRHRVRSSKKWSGTPVEKPRQYRFNNPKADMKRLRAMKKKALKRKKAASDPAWDRVLDFLAENA
jgi:hypothetical protein